MDVLNNPTPKPVTQSVTIRAAAVSLLPVAFKLLRRERPTFGDLITVASAAGVVYGRMRPGAGQPLTVG